MSIMFGAEVAGLKTLQHLHHEGLGNCAGISFPKTLEEGLEIVRYCRDNNIHFIFREALRRELMELPPDELLENVISPGDLKKIIAEAGDYYHGRMIIGESGGMLYWPLEYLREPFQGEDGGYYGGPWTLLPQNAANVTEAEAIYAQRLEKYIAVEKALGGEPFWDVDGSMVFKQHLNKGITVPYLEMMPGQPERMIPALRGAAKAFGCGTFGTLIAFGWYGGGKWDELFFKRWKRSLYYSYMNGMKWIISESGHFGFEGYENNISYDHPLAVRFRDTMRDFKEFIEHNPRPESGPEVKIGILYGQGDGYPGLWTNSVWGQYENNSEWRCSEAEKSWDLLETFHRRRSWQDNMNIGKDDISGNPPCGLFDIVPAEASEDKLASYSCLIMLGWNTMTVELYEKLIGYVKRGGHLIAGLPHFATNEKRNEKLKLINDGDLNELFGVVIDGCEDAPVTGVKFADSAATPAYRFSDWSDGCDPKCQGKGFDVGRIIENKANVLAYSAKYFFSAKTNEPRLPVVLEHQLGDGSAFLVNSWEYPGSENMTELWQYLLYAAIAAEQPKDIRIIASDKIRYAIYRQKDTPIVMLLNTDYDLPTSCRIEQQEAINEFTLAPGEFKQWRGEASAGGIAF